MLIKDVLRITLKIRSFPSKNQDQRPPSCCFTKCDSNENFGKSVLKNLAPFFSEVVKCGETFWFVSPLYTASKKLSLTLLQCTSFFDISFTWKWRIPEKHPYTVHYNSCWVNDNTCWVVDLWILASLFKVLLG